MANYYDEYDNELYNPDDGHDSKEPGLNANWKAIQKGFYQVEADINDLNDRVTVAETNVENLGDRVEAMEDDVDNLKTRMTSAESTLTSHETRITTAEDNITQLRTDVDTNAEDISGLKTRMASAESSISQLETDVHINRLDINVNTDDISSLKTRVSTAEGNITTINTKNTQQDARLDAIEQVNTQQTQRLSSAEGNITANANAINALGVRVTRAEDDIDAVEADVDNLQTETVVECYEGTSDNVTRLYTTAEFTDADTEFTNKGKVNVSGRNNGVEITGFDNRPATQSYFAGSITREDVYGNDHDFIKTTKFDLDHGEVPTEYDLTKMTEDIDTNHSQITQINVWSVNVQRDINNLKTETKVETQSITSGGVTGYGTVATFKDGDGNDADKSKAVINAGLNYLELESDDTYNNTYFIANLRKDTGNDILTIVKSNEADAEYNLTEMQNKVGITYKTGSNYLVAGQAIGLAARGDSGGNDEAVITSQNVSFSGLTSGKKYLVIPWIEVTTSQQDFDPIFSIQEYPKIYTASGSSASLSFKFYAKNMGSSQGSLYYYSINAMLIRIN